MTKPQIEAIKEIGRWIVLFIASWIIVQIVNQIAVVPQIWDLKIWEFHFFIPVRELFLAGLTLAGRFIDKWKFESSKELSESLGNKELRKGLLPF